MEKHPVLFAFVMEYKKCVPIETNLKTSVFFFRSFRFVVLSYCFGFHCIAVLVDLLLALALTLVLALHIRVHRNCLVIFREF